MPSVLVLLAGCGATQSANTPASVVQTTADESAATTSDSPPTVSTVREFPPGESWDEAVQPLIVRVSNQAFDDPDVQLSASLDGVVLFDQVFAVEGQHTVTLFGVDVAPGPYTFTVMSDTGGEVKQAFDLPAGEQRWLVVDYWYFDPDAQGQYGHGRKKYRALPLTCSCLTSRSTLTEFTAASPCKNCAK